MRNQPLLKSEIAVRTPSGDIEVIDMLTGEVIANDHGNIPAQTAYAFDYGKALMICQLVTEGTTMTKISQMAGMPDMYTISHWQRTDRMFAETLKMARAARTDFHHEKLLDVAEAAINGDFTKDEVPGVKLGTDILMKSIEKANPEKYGTKVTHEGSTEKPILLRVVNTGINRAIKPEQFKPKQEIIDVEANTDED